MAQGYFQRPDLTAERFLTDPQSGTRFYKSGDMVIQHASGEFESRGRLDHQVKIRGFRVELGEIEAALREHPGIRDAVVLARPAGEHVQLAAWIVPADDLASRDLDARDYLRQRLPDYMQPSHYVTIAEVPLTGNGKIDRARLPEPSRAPAGRPPGTESERVMGEIWKDLLGLDAVSVDDDFFDVGGNSILAVRLVARVFAATGRQLPLRHVFVAPTLEAMAAAVDGAEPQRAHQSSAASPIRSQGTAAGVVPLNSGGRGAPLFLPFSLGGAISGHELADLIDHPLLGLAPPADADQEDISAIAEALADTIEMAHPAGPFALAGYSFAGMLAYEVAVVLQRRGRDVPCLIVIDVGPRLARSVSSRCMSLLRGVANVPRWFRDQVREETLSGVVAAARRKGRAFTRRGLARIGVGAHRGEALRFDDMFGGAPVAEANRLAIEAHLKAVMSQRMRPYPGTLVLMRARTRPLRHSFEPDLGWGACVDGHVEVVAVAANHHTIVQPPHLTDVAREILVRLDRLS